MSEEIKSLKPSEIWENFYGLTQVPRPSKHEAKVTEFVRKFGEKLGLKTTVDHAGNVIIRKPATPGMENRKPIVLQAHLDMVPQKNSETIHDFEKDPIDAYIDGEWVRARGTTLGADNGIGAAAIMGVLASKTLKHGPLEGLFTIDEETGMTGAIELSPNALKGEILLNLDSETEGEIYVGCAGGLDGTLKIPVEVERVSRDRAGVAIAITGLKGGHSGMDIILGRANSIKLMARLLVHLQRDDARIVSIEGGSLRNAIPREAFCTLAIPTTKLSRFKTAATELIARIKEEYKAVDPNLSITLKDTVVKGEKCFTAHTHLASMQAVLGIPNGVIRMSDAMPGLVETSSNLASLRVERNRVICQCLLRSSVESAKQALAEEMGGIVELAGGNASFDNGYPGWNPNMNSPILKTMREVYEHEYKKKPAIMAIHAGLECGILGGSYPKMDMISFGPTIMSPHSPDERVKIDTVGKFWDFLCKILENSPKK